MAGIFANIDSDIQKLQRLKQEIENVKKSLKSINVKVDINIAQGLEAQLKSLTNQYSALAAKVGETETRITASANKIIDASNKIIQAQDKMSQAEKGINTSSSANTNSSTNASETTSIQAQVKAYEELKAEIGDVLGTRGQNIKRLIEEQNAIRLLNAEIKKITKSQGESSSLSSAQQRRLEQLNNSLLTHKTTLAEVRQSLSANAKLDNAAATSMDALSQSLGRMRAAYRALTESERTSSFGKELLVSIQQADAKIKELDAMIGNHQRNVGNYASGWNGLSMSIQQIGRELPSLANGWRTFFLAISNNLPILADEIKRARIQFEALKKSGQTATPVWKQVVSSIVSWQTALTVGITLLTLYGDKLVKWGKDVLIGESATEKLKKQMIELNAIEKDAYAIQIRTRSELNNTISSIKAFNGTKEQEKRKVDELNSKYGAIFGTYNTLAQWYDVLINKGNSYINSLFAQAKAQSYIQKAIEADQKLRDIKAKGQEEYTPFFGAGGKLYQFFGGSNKNQYGSNPAELAYNEALNSVEKEREDAIKNAEALYAQYLKEIKNNSLFDYRNLFIDGSKESKDQQKIVEELLSLRRQNQQAEIDLMKEGTKKKLKQIDLDYQKELDAIKKQEKELLERQKGKLTSEQAIEISARYTNAENKRDKAIADVTKEQLKAEQQALNDYLKEYGTFQQKKEAITKEYNDKIANATTEGDKKILQKQMEEALSSVDMDKLKQEINWELIFSDLNKVSKKSLEQVKQQLKTFKNSDEYKNMAVDQKKVIDEALNNIQSTIIDKGGLLGDLPEQLEALRIAQDELKQAQDEYNKSLKSGTDAEKEAALKKKNKAEKNVQNAETNVTRSADKTYQNLITLADTITQLGSSSEMSLSQIGSLASGLIDTFTEAGSKIGGIVGAVFSLLDGIEKQGFDGFVKNVFSSVFGAGASMWNTITFGGFNKLFGVGGNAKEVQDTIDRLTDRNETLQTAIEDLTDVMEASKGTKSVAAYTDAKKLQEETEENYKKIAQEQARYSNSHHSWNYYWGGFNQDEIARLSSQIGRNWNGDIWSLSPEEMKMLRSNVDMWEKIQNTGKGNYGGRLTEKLNDYIDQAGKMEELTNKLYEGLTGISFESMYDSFIDTLMDMDASAEDAADNIADYFMRAMLSNKIGELYSEKLEAWWKKFGKSMEDNELTESEREALQNEYMQYVEEAMKIRDEIAAATGYTGSSSSSSQETSKKGFATASQDSIDELNGRFTALQIAGEEIKNQNQQQTMSILELKAEMLPIIANTSGIKDIASETRDLLRLSYEAIVDIRDNTNVIVKPIQQMASDIAEVKRNTNGLTRK